MNIHLISLGCPKNLVDSEILMGGLAEAGVNFVDDPHLAETIIINTCGFTEDARKESIETIFSAVRLKQQGLCRHVLVTGCLSERYQEELRREIPEVEGLWGARGVEKIPRQMAERLGLPQWQKVGSKRQVTTGPSYAYLKIAEGCDNLCSFCAIPAIRGPYRSRPPQEILPEAEALVHRGMRELVLIAQDTTYYGTDLGGYSNLAILLKQLEGISDLHWIRLLYTYPERISEELIETIADSKKICRYIDIPIQHISDELLHKMRRGSRRRKIEMLIDKLRSKIPDIAIRTSVIVGFPGESDQHFEELLEFIQEMKFERLGVFQFSPEEGTEAARVPRQVPEELKQQRYETLMDVQYEIVRSLNRQIIGKEIEVHVDYRHDGQVVARSQWDAPEIDQLIYLEGEVDPGCFVKAKIIDIRDYDLIGILNGKNPS